MIVLNSVVIPMLFWILPDQCSQISTQVPCSFGGILKLYSVLRLGLIQLFYVSESNIIIILFPHSCNFCNDHCRNVNWLSIFDCIY